MSWTRQKHLVPRIDIFYGKSMICAVMSLEVKIQSSNAVHNSHWIIYPEDMYKVKEHFWKEIIYICRWERKQVKMTSKVNDVVIKNPIYCTVWADKHFLEAFTGIEI